MTNTNSALDAAYMAKAQQQMMYAAQKEAYTACTDVYAEFAIESATRRINEIAESLAELKFQAVDIGSRLLGSIPVADGVGGCKLPPDGAINNLNDGIDRLASLLAPLGDAIQRLEKL